MNETGETGTSHQMPEDSRDQISFHCPNTKRAINTRLSYNAIAQKATFTGEKNESTTRVPETRSGFGSLLRSPLSADRRALAA